MFQAPCSRYHATPSVPRSPSRGGASTSGVRNPARSVASSNGRISLRRGIGLGLRLAQVAASSMSLPLQIEKPAIEAGDRLAGLREEPVDDLALDATEGDALALRTRFAAGTGHHGAGRDRLLDELVHRRDCLGRRRAVFTGFGGFRNRHHAPHRSPGREPVPRAGPGGRSFGRPTALPGFDIARRVPALISGPHWSLSRPPCLRPPCLPTTVAGFSPPWRTGKA